MDESDVIVRLLSEGVFVGEYTGSMASLNKQLKILQYEAMQWPDGSCIVLRDNNQHPADPRAGEIEEIFVGISLGRDVAGDLVDMLVRNGWIEERSGRLGLTKRSLVQHRELVSGLEGRYRMCEMCGFLSDGDNLHAFCRELARKNAM